MRYIHSCDRHSFGFKVGRNRWSEQIGMTLIEVLVTLIIISIGLLGVAGLQVVGIKQTANSGMQTQAMLLAGDLIERIRANRSAIVDGNGLTITMAAYGKAAGTAFPTGPAGTCTVGAGCSPADMARTDLFNWSRAIQNSLPVVASTLTNNMFICLDSNTTDALPCDGLGSTVVVQLAWLDSTRGVVNGALVDNAATGAVSLHTYQMVFEP